METFLTVVLLASILSLYHIFQFLLCQQNQKIVFNEIDHDDAEERDERDKDKGKAEDEL